MFLSKQRHELFRTRPVMFCCLFHGFETRGNSLEIFKSWRETLSVSLGLNPGKTYPQGQDWMLFPLR